MKVDWTIVSHYITQSFSSWMVGRIFIMSLGLKGLRSTNHRVTSLFFSFICQKYSQDLALNLDNPRKLMVLGISKDFGHCKGLKRKDGQPCSNIVNRWETQRSASSWNFGESYDTRQEKTVVLQLCKASNSTPPPHPTPPHPRSNILASVLKFLPWGGHSSFRYCWLLLWDH